MDGEGLMLVLLDWLTLAFKVPPFLNETGCSHCENLPQNVWETEA